MRKVSHQFRFRLLGLALVCAGYAALTACSSADNELARFIEDTKKEPGGRVEPLPEIKPYETFLYSAAELRSPFLPRDRKSTRLNSSHSQISYAVFCLKKKKNHHQLNR